MARAALGDDAFDRRVRFESDSESARLGGHGLRDRAHAAHRMSPDAGLAVHFAEHMVQQHIGAARRVRARVVADHGVETVQRLHGVALEPVV